MKVPIWAHESATFFWEAAGIREPFPRGLREPIHRSPFDLTIKEIPGLSTATVGRYLARLGPGWTCGGPDRAVRACLAARDGAGFILLDATDPPAERIFSLAHELSHFLWHYSQRRQRLNRQVGDSAIEVFDGKRKPAPAERLRALLSNVPLRPHMHLMDRAPESQILEESVAIAEEEADRLAYELLAPADSVWAKQREIQLADDKRSGLASMLEGDFGLPPGRAAAYSRLLLPPTVADPLISSLRSKP
jgi:hypothetical protein